jgi:hypothetical protein
MPYQNKNSWPPQHTEMRKIKAGQLWRSYSGLITCRIVSAAPHLNQTLFYMEMGFTYTKPGQDRFLGVQVEWPHDAPIQSVVHELDEFLARYTLIQDVPCPT